jgi:hypothetical protein
LADWPSLDVGPPVAAAASLSSCCFDIFCSAALTELNAIIEAAAIEMILCMACAIDASSGNISKYIVYEADIFGCYKALSFGSLLGSVEKRPCPLSTIEVLI